MESSTLMSTGGSSGLGPHVDRGGGGKMGRLKAQISEQAILVEDMENELTHTNETLTATKEELEYRKKLSARSKMLEEEHKLSAVEDLEYQNQVLQLELQGIYETSQMYDYQEVDEQNRDLRQAVSQLHDENLQLNQLITEDGRAAMEREGQTRLFLEREYRDQLKGAEGRIKEELFSKLDDRTKNIVLQHRKLQDDLFLLKFNIKEFDNRYRQVDDERKVLNIDNTINKEMNEMMVKEIVGLKKKLAASEEGRHVLEDMVKQLRGQVHLMQEDAGVARSAEEMLSGNGQQSPASRAGQRYRTTPGRSSSASRHSNGEVDHSGIEDQQMGPAQAASLQQEIGRYKKKEQGLRDQRDKWRTRAFKLEQMCSVLQDDLGSAINAAKSLVSQSNGSVWHSRPEWENGDPAQVLDGFIQVDRTLPGGDLESESFGVWETSTSEPAGRKPKPARPASAQPTRARPGSGRPKPSGRSRPKSALPTSGGSRQRASRTGHSAASRVVPDTTDQECYPFHTVREQQQAALSHNPSRADDVQASSSHQQDNAQAEARQAVPVSVPSGGYTLGVRSETWAVPAPSTASTTATIHEDVEVDNDSGGDSPSPSTRLVQPEAAAPGPDVTIQGLHGSRASISTADMPRDAYLGRSTVSASGVVGNRPMSARPPSARTGHRPVSTIQTPQFRHPDPPQSPVQGAAHRPASAVVRGSHATVRQIVAHCPISPASPSMVARRMSSAHSGSSQAGAGSSSPHLRRGQSASDFIRRTRKEYMYSGKSAFT